MNDKIIREIVKKEFNAKVIKIDKIKDGFSHFMFDVNIDKEPKLLIIRFSNNSLPEFSLDKEKSVMGILEKNNILVPKVYTSTPDYMIMEKIKGERLDKIWSTLNNEQKIKYTIEIGVMLKKIHKIKFDRFGYLLNEGKVKIFDKSYEFKNTGKKAEQNEFLRIFFRDMSDQFADFLSYKKVNLDFFNSFIKFLTLNLHKISYIGKPSLIHGDLIPAHIFVDQENLKITGIIDFEHAAAYPPEYDFIKLHRCGFFSEKDINDALISAYGKIDEQAVEIYRTIRDFQFGIVLLNSGNKEKATEVLSMIKEKIDFKGNIFIS